MKIGTEIEGKIRTALLPAYLELLNESHMHSGPATESHFKLIVVAEAFEGLNKVQRHRKVYGLLSAELSGPVHALALHLFTPLEWLQAEVHDSPNCQKKVI